MRALRFPIGCLLVSFAALHAASPAQALTAHEPARVAQPGELVLLEAREAPPGGRVWFTLPEGGPEGAPGGAFADGSTRIAVTAGASGVAEVSFTAGSAIGAFLADAALEEGSEIASFAITVLAPEASPPPVSAAQARAAAEGEVLAEEALHGPVLLRAGTEVRTPVPPVVFNHGAPFALERDAWLAWAEPSTDGRFGRRTRWLVIDAEDGAVRTTRQDWWPEVRMRGDAAAQPLLGASRANRRRPGGFTPPSPLPPAPADACFVGVAGDRVAEAMDDVVAAQRWLAETGRVAPSAMRFGRTAAQVRNALQESADEGCRALFLLVTAHAGQARGGGVLMEPDDGLSYLTYAELAEWLAPFARVEAVLATSFAAEAAGWFDGRGFEGVALPLASEQGAAATVAAARLIAAAAESGANLPEAHQTLAGEGVFPAGHAIEPGGPRRMWQPDADIHDAGGLQRIDVSRPLNLDLGPTLIYNASSEAPAIAGIQTKVFVLPSDQDSLRFSLGGVARGTTRYELTMNDSAQQVYTARGRIDVGSFTVAPDGVALRVGGAGGERQNVTIRRHGHWQRRGAPARFRIVSRDESIVKPLESAVETSGDEASFELEAAGAGTTTVDIWDETAAKAASVEVHVLGPADAACPVRGRATVNYTVAPGGDPSSAAARIALSQGTLYWQREGGRVMLWGDRAPMVTAYGMVDAACRFAAAGDGGQERISGSRGVEAVYADGRIADGEIRFTYRLGPLEDGAVVTYTAEGAAAPHDGLLGAGGLWAKQSGGQFSVGVGASDEWTATSDAEWIRVLGNGDGGDGPGLLRLLVIPNGSAERRSGTVTAAGETLTVVQAAGPDLAEPLVTAVSNGASFQQGVAPGAWLTISGFGLADETRAWFTEPAEGASQAGGPLPTELAGVSVTIGGLAAYVQFVSPGQINVLAPDGLPLGRAEVTVSNQGRRSAPVWTSVEQLAPELFRFQPREGRYPAAVHPDGTLAGPAGLFRTTTTRPVKPGDPVMLFGSGFGATSPPTPTGFLVTTPRELASPVVASVGGKPAEVLFGGLVGAGLYQINVVIPQLPPGEYPLELWSAGRSLRTTAVVAVE